MASQRIVARQAREFVPPQFSRSFYRFALLVGPLYMRAAQGVRETRVAGMHHLHAAVRRFQRAESRLLILFRHVDVADGPVILKLVMQELPHWCRVTGNRLPADPHTHFLFGRDVLNWAGPPARLAFPRLGGIPVTNERIYRQSQETVREIVRNGAFPLAFAPEGQVTYHQFTSFPPVAGASTLPAWAWEAWGEKRAVDVLPVSIGYTYGARSESVLRDTAQRIAAELTASGERAADSSGEPSADPPPEPPGAGAGPVEWAGYLRDLTRLIVDQLERDYPFITDREGPGAAVFMDDTTLQARIDRLTDTALRTGERATGLPSDGTVLSRVFRLRYWIMSSWHRDDVDLESLSPAERALADNRAAVATAVRPYERLADIMEYLHPAYLDAVAVQVAARAWDRLVEYALNLCDVLNRLGGGSVDTRYSPGGRIARLVVGAPLDAAAAFREAGSRRAGMRLLNEEVAVRLRTVTGELERYPE